MKAFGVDCIRAPRHALVTCAEWTFTSPQAWAIYKQVATEETAGLNKSKTVKWLATNEIFVLNQMAARGRRPGPESTGPLEVHIRKFRVILKDRPALLRNRTRTNRLLQLLVANANGHASDAAWTERIMQDLRNRESQPRAKQRQILGQLL